MKSRKAHQRKGQRWPEWLPVCYDPDDFNEFAATFKINVIYSPPPVVVLTKNLRLRVRELLKHVANFIF